MIRAILAFSRGIMVIVLFLAFLALFAAGALTVYAVGLFLTGMPVADITALAAPPAGGAPSPAQLAGALTIIVALFTSMWAMIVSESAPDVRRFMKRVLRTALIWAILLAIPVALMASGIEGTPVERYRPAVLLVVAALVAAFLASFLLGKLFLVYVSEKPWQPRRPQRRRRAEAPPPETDAPATA